MSRKKINDLWITWKINENFHESWNENVKWQCDKNIQINFVILKTIKNLKITTTNKKQ